jgi:hypothetical protein
VPVARASGGGVLGHKEVAGDRFEAETGAKAHQDRLPATAD